MTQRAEIDIANLWEGVGVTHTRVNSADMTTAADISPTPAAGARQVITDILLSTDTAMNVTIKNETGTVLSGPYYLPVNGTIQITTRSRFLKNPVADEKFQAQASVAGNLTVETWTYDEE